MVIKLSPVSRKHDILFQFLVVLLRHYLKRTQVGQLMVEPFVMRLKPGTPGHEPDLQIVLNEHADIIQETMVNGPADVVIEIVSKESQNRDLIDKYEEYETGGVREYWLFNPLRKQSDFYALGDDGLYRRIEPKDDDDRIRALVDEMLKKDS